MGFFVCEDLGDAEWIWWLGRPLWAAYSDRACRGDSERLLAGSGDAKVARVHVCATKVHRSCLSNGGGAEAMRGLRWCRGGAAAVMWLVCAQWWRDVEAYLCAAAAHSWTAWRRFVNGIEAVGTALLWIRGGADVRGGQGGWDEDI